MPLIFWVIVNINPANSNIYVSNLAPFKSVDKAQQFQN